MFSLRSGLMNTPMPDTYGLQGMAFNTSGVPQGDPTATPQSGNGLSQDMGQVSSSFDQATSGGQFDPGNMVSHSYTGHAQMPTVMQQVPSSGGGGGGGDPNSAINTTKRLNAHIQSGEGTQPGKDYSYDSWLSHSQGRI